MLSAGGYGFGRQLLACRNTLLSQRAALDAAIAGLDQALATMGAPRAASMLARGAAPGVFGATRRRGRPLKEDSLKNYIKRVLQNEPQGMRVKEIAQAVKRAGYQSASRSFGNQVSAALASMPSDLHKLGRGTFKLR
jgi:hypothetical protein